MATVDHNQPVFTCIGVEGGTKSRAIRWSLVITDINH